MGADESGGDAFAFDLRHVAGDALASRAAGPVMCMLLDRGGARAIWGERAMAIETEFVGGLSQLRVIVRAVNIMAGKTGYAARIHNALHEVVALHAVFVRCTVREMGEGCFAEGVVFELPIIL
jgi:hypothetical protein